MSFKKETQKVVSVKDSSGKHKVNMKSGTRNLYS